MKDKLKDKRVITALVIVIITVIGIIVFVMTQLNNSVLQLKSKEVTVEYGQKISLEAREYLKDSVDSKIIAETKAIIKEDVVITDNKEYLEVGEYTVVLTYEEDTVEVKVIVKDTTAPVFKEFKDSIETAKEVKPDYATLYVAEDLAKVTITCDDANVKYDTVGDYKATVKASDTSKNETTKEIIVNVTEPTIKLDKESASLYVKETLVLKTTITGKEQKATFKSSDEKIASVDQDGKVTAKAKGTTTITASANGKDITCKITVKETPSGSSTTTKKDNNGNNVTVVTPPSSNGSSGSGGPTQSSPKISMEAFNLINNERVNLGLEKLTYDSSLANIAIKRAKELQTNFSHDGLNKYDPSHHIGEVITMQDFGNYPASEAVKEWMNSKAHRNIIMRNYRTTMAVAYLNNRWVALVGGDNGAE